jgi:hypothetical protein
MISGREMDTIRLTELRTEFSKLTERWKAASDLNERLALNEEIDKVLTETQGIIQRYLKQLGDWVRRPHARTGSPI